MNQCDKCSKSATTFVGNRQWCHDCFLKAGPTFGWKCYECNINGIVLEGKSTPEHCNCNNIPWQETGVGKLMLEMAADREKN